MSMARFVIGDSQQGTAAVPPTTAVGCVRNPLVWLLPLAAVRSLLVFGYLSVFVDAVATPGNGILVRESYHSSPPPLLLRVPFKIARDIPQQPAPFAHPGTQLSRRTISPAPAAYEHPRWEP